MESAAAPHRQSTAPEAPAPPAPAPPAPAQTAAQPVSIVISLAPSAESAAEVPKSTERYDFSGARAFKVAGSPYTYLDRVIYKPKDAPPRPIAQYDRVSFRTKARKRANTLTGTVAFVAVKHRQGKDTAVEA